MFAQNLKYLRNQRGWDQQTFASMIHRSVSTVSEWESGKYTPKAGLLADIANIFDVQLDDMMNTDFSTKRPVKTTVEKTVDILNQLDSNRQSYVYGVATDQLEQQHKEAEAHNDSVVKLQPKKSSTPDPFMPIAAHLDHELSDDERTEVDAWERKIATADDDDDEDDDN